VTRQADLQDHDTSGYESALGVTSTQTVRLGAFTTESGHRFSSVDVSYQALGKLSPQRDNVILICHALSGDARVAGVDETTGRPGWWDFHVGPGKTIDTDRFHVICTNVLGGCAGTTGPSSLRPGRRRERYGSDFPAVTIRDMVGVQAMLLDHLGIERLFAVVGGSLGGMQAMAWAVQYPDRVQCLVPIATCLAHRAAQIAFNEIARHAISHDPHWKDGHYPPSRPPRRGLEVARMIGHITYLSNDSMTRKFGRRRREERHPSGLFEHFFDVESYLHHQGESFVKRFDANSLIYLTKAADVFDLLDRKAELKHVRAKTLVISFVSDWLYTPAQSRDITRALKRHGVEAQHVNLPSKYGHDSFLVENPEFSAVLGDFLRAEYEATLSRKPSRKTKR
jgi:homoserine O-acetyltransferase/O-succinyltransferase